MSGSTCICLSVARQRRRGRGAQGSADSGVKQMGSAAVFDTVDRKECILFVRDGSCPYPCRCNFAHPLPAGNTAKGSGIISIVATAMGAKRTASRWILGTNASLDLCGHSIEGAAVALDRSVLPETASGQIEVQEGIRADVGGIGKQVTCEGMARGVQALTIGKRCSFAWKTLESRPDLLSTPPGPPSRRRTSCHC